MGFKGKKSQKKFESRRLPEHLKRRRQQQKVSRSKNKKELAKLEREAEEARPEKRGRVVAKTDKDELPTEFNNNDFTEQGLLTAFTDNSTTEIDEPSTTTTTNKKALTIESVKEIQKQALESQSMDSIRSVVSVFAVCCGSNPPAPKVFQNVVGFCFRTFPGMFDGVVGVDTGFAATPLTLPLTNNKWNKWSNEVEQYVKLLVALLGRVGLAESNMQRLVLEHIERMAPYFACCVAVGKRLVRLLLRLWGSTQNDGVRVGSFLVLRRLSAYNRFPFLELSLKGMYLTLISCCKGLNARTFDQIVAMRNGFIEMCGIDFISTYQHAFVYLRQLSLLLRDALTAKTKDAYKKVYNWSFIGPLELWIATINSYPNEQQLRPLAHPLGQIVTTTISVVPTSRYFPLRLHCCRLATALCRGTGVFLPVVPRLLEILKHAVFTKAGKNNKLTTTDTTPLDFTTALKTPKQLLTTRTFQASLINEALFRLLEYFAVFAGSPAFPELCLSCLVELKHYKQETASPKLSKQFAALIDKLEAHWKWIDSKRSLLETGPGNTDGKVFETRHSDNIKNSPFRKHLETAVKLREKEEEERRKVVRESETNDSDGEGGDWEDEDESEEDNSEADVDDSSD